MIDWRIYYGDETTFDSTQGNPNDAPTLNIVSIVSMEKKGFKEVHDVGRIVFHQWDYYIYRTSIGWYGVKGEVDLLDHLLSSFKDIEVILKARMVELNTFKKIFKRSIEDPDFPRKTGWIKNYEAEWIFLKDIK